MASSATNRARCHSIASGNEQVHAIDFSAHGLVSVFFIKTLSLRDSQVRFKIRLRE